MLLCLAMVGLVGRRRGAWALVVGVGAIASDPATAAEIALTRTSRPVTSAEISGGAPSDGMVHDLFITSDADLLSLDIETGLSVYNHPLGTDNSMRPPEFIAAFPAVGADSFLRLPSDTVMFGGFDAAANLWGDLVNDGPQTNFQFGRLTTTQAGTFSGRVAVRGETSPITIPFSLSLPGGGESLWSGGGEQLSLSGFEPPPPAPPERPKPANLNQATAADFHGPVTIEVSRRSRPVSDAERREGVPDGYVHDFFVTTSTDLISIGNVDIEAEVYQHMEGSNRKPPNERVLRIWPATSADSFITTPGRTAGMGSGFYGDSDKAEIIWFDQQDDGPPEGIPVRPADGRGDGHVLRRRERARPGRRRVAAVPVRPGGNGAGVRPARPGADVSLVVPAGSCRAGSRAGDVGAGRARGAGHCAANSANDAAETNVSGPSNLKGSQKSCQPSRMGPPPRQLSGGVASLKPPAGGFDRVRDQKSLTPLSLALT